jgi:hypothetical protein
MSDFDDWLTSNGKCRETASDLDEIQWLRLERQRLQNQSASPKDKPMSDARPVAYKVQLCGRMYGIYEDRKDAAAIEERLLTEWNREAVEVLPLYCSPEPPEVK